MSETSKAVFLSYASQDAEAAKRIAGALRAAGVEVWFDQSELVGGDAWDAKIRKQIKECALFLPVISTNTQARREGYFRIEWKLAAQRTHAIADGTPFLVPVVIDDTRDAGALVPDAFTEVQWTRLPGGEAMPAFAARVKKLLSGEMQAGRPRPAEQRGGPADAGPPPGAGRAPRVGPWLAIGASVIVALVLAITRPWHRAATPVTPVPVSEARRLASQARELLLKPSGGPGKYETAVLLCDRALALDPTDAEVWAIASQVDTNMVRQSFDPSEKRVASAQGKAAKAINLAPHSFEARLALAAFQAMIGGPPMVAEGESALRALRAENPRELRVLYALMYLLRLQGRGEEALAMADEAIRLPGGAMNGFSQKAWALRGMWRFDEAEAAADQSIALEPMAGNVGLKVFLDLSWRGDPDQALAALRKLPAEELTMDVGVAAAVRLYRWRREPGELLKFLAAVPREWLPWSIAGPKAALTGDANAELNRPEAARADWQSALALIEQRLAATPNDRNLLEWKAYLEASLGEAALAQVTWRRSREASPFLQPLLNVEKIQRVLAPDQVMDELEQRVAAVISNLGQRRDSYGLFISAADLRLNPAWDGIRQLPRFQALQARLDADPHFSPTARPPATQTSAAIDEKSVAVLAFADLSEKHDSEYFSDGISEELLNVLAKIPNLKVSARTSAFFFKGKEVPVPEIAKQLGVAYVVEGSVRKQGDKVRITAQLIKAADGFHVWSDTFTRDLKDIFAVQDEIAGLIARNLQLTLTGSGQPRQEVNPEAHRLVLEARHFWNNRTMAGFERAEAAARQAIALDPEFAQAHAMLAIVTVTRAVYRGYEGLADDGVPVARQSAERALALDPSLVEAQAALGVVALIEGRLEESERIFRGAIASNPNQALPHHWFSLLLEATGRLDEALQEIGRAIDLDPLSGVAIGTRGRYLAWAGRDEEASAAFARATPLLPERPTLYGFPAECLLRSGRKDEAVAVARKVLTFVGKELRLVSDFDAIYVLQQTGHGPEAAEFANGFLQRYAPDSYQRGTMLVSLGRWEEGEPYLERTPWPMRYMFYWDPAWDAWRDDPRFHQLLAKLGCTKEYQVARETLARLQWDGAKK